MANENLYCKECGSPLVPDSNFCPQCGHNNASQPQQPNAQAAPIQPQAIQKPSTPVPPPRPQNASYAQPVMPPEQPAQKNNLGLILSIIGGFLFLVALAVGIYLYMSDGDKSERETFVEEENVEMYDEEFAPTSNLRERISSQRGGGNAFANESDFDIAFNKILRDELLTRSDIAMLNSEELRILRNLPYAQHGRRFKSPELQQFFSQFEWYTPMYNDVSISNLTSNDRENINLIQQYER